MGTQWISTFATLSMISLMHNCQKKLNGKFQKQTILHFKLHAVLCSVMGCPAVLPHSAWGVTHPLSGASMQYALSAYYLLCSHVSYLIDGLSLVVLVFK